MRPGDEGRKWRSGRPTYGMTVCNTPHGRACPTSITKLTYVKNRRARARVCNVRVFLSSRTLVARVLLFSGDGLFKNVYRRNNARFLFRRFFFLVIFHARRVSRNACGSRAPPPSAERNNSRSAAGKRPTPTVIEIHPSRLLRLLY